MNAGRVIGIATGVVAAVAFAIAWMFFAPTQAGGGTSYAIIVGNSMEPVLHRGDLAVIRKRSVYRPGDVVLYDSRELGEGAPPDRPRRRRAVRAQGRQQFLPRRRADDRGADRRQPVGHRAGRWTRDRVAVGSRSTVPSSSAS